MALARIVPIALVALVGATFLSAHPHHRLLPSQEASTPPPGTIAPGAKGVSGQGALRFRVVPTSLGGDLLNTLASPTGDDDLGLPSVRDYFAGGGSFAPTDVAFLEGLLYVTTGYSSLDTVLTARVSAYNPLRTAWHDLAFGGRASGPGQFGTGHSITVPPGTRRIDVADRLYGGGAAAGGGQAGHHRAGLE